MRSLATLWFVQVTAQALDLTPHQGFRQGNEGAPTPVVEFTDGKSKIDYRPPQGWEPSGGGNSVSFFSKETNRAWMKLMVIEKEKDQSSAVPTASKEELQAWAAKFVPVGAEKLEFIRTVPSPFTIGARESTEFVFTFVFFGSRDSISISVVDLNQTERLLMLVSADAANFERIRQQAVASMFSWSATE
jgi:hypothetical protein